MVTKVACGGKVVEVIGICFVCGWEVFGGDWNKVTKGVFSCSE